MQKRLIEGARLKHARATAAMLYQLQNRWYRYALARTGSPRRAVEVVQDAALALMAERATMPKQEAFDAWAIGFAVRSAAEPDGPGDRVKTARAAGLPLPTGHLDDSDRAVLAVLQTLPPAPRGCLLMRIGERLTRRDIVGITGLAPPDVTAHVRSAIDTLRAVPLADWPVDPQIWYAGTVYPSDLRAELFVKRKPRWLGKAGIAGLIVSGAALLVANHFKPVRTGPTPTTAVAPTSR
jgi:DNA-directed RNA polymerase specialized sigma24 family protein